MAFAFFFASSLWNNAAPKGSNKTGSETVMTVINQYQEMKRIEAVQEGINNTPSPRSMRVGPATEDYEKKGMENKSACIALLDCLGKMVLCMILLGGKSSQSPTQENLEDQLKRAKDRVEAYSELALVTALVFGFAVTSFIEASDTANELSSSENGYRSKAAAALSVVMCLVFLSTASSLMAVIGHNFVLKRLQVSDCTKLY
jgi:multisubunit Na+/H+ antiporter MnhC subunit